MDLQDLDLAQLAEQRMNVNQQLEDLKAEKEQIDEVIQEKMNTDSKMAGNYAISIIRKVLFTKVPLEVARKYGAVKTEEKVDSDALRPVYDSGVELEGVTESVYVTVKDMTGNMSKRKS